MLFLCPFHAPFVTDKLRLNLEDENKANTFLMYVQQVYLMKNKKTRKQKAYFITVVQFKELSSFILLFIFFQTFPIVLCNKCALHYLNTYAKSMYNNEVRDDKIYAFFSFFSMKYIFTLGISVLNIALMIFNKIRTYILLQKIFIKNYK